MQDSFFITLNQWITGGTALAGVGCFVWGVISVLFSPCHLASIPLMVGYVGGQEKMINPRKAGLYSVLFTSGLFITITMVGIICSLLGRMLGDVGNYWQIFVGVLLIWVALGILGVEKCSMSGSLLTKLNLRGMSGAFVLGLSYGILSGSCTFGFIPPILAIITVQQKVMTGIALILLFGIGHCLPIVVAGSSTATVQKLLENGKWIETGRWFKTFAGVTIVLLGLYFIAIPLI